MGRTFCYSILEVQILGSCDFERLVDVVATTRRCCLLAFWVVIRRRDCCSFQVRTNGLTQNHAGSKARLSSGKFAEFKKTPLNSKKEKRRDRAKGTDDGENIRDKSADKIEQESL